MIVFTLKFCFLSSFNLVFTFSVTTTRYRKQFIPFPFTNSWRWKRDRVNRNVNKVHVTFILNIILRRLGKIFHILHREVIFLNHDSYGKEKFLFARDVHLHSFFLNLCRCWFYYLSLILFRFSRNLNEWLR